MTNPLQHDLDQILTHTEGLWEELRGQRLFITGGTGFFGCWLLESFCWANDKLGLGAKAVVLTRDPERFKRKAPHLTRHPAVQLHTGDVRTFDFPAGRFSHVIHAATESSTGLNESAPLTMLDTIIAGTRRTLDFTLASGAKRFLLTSSGAVYGHQPPDLTHVPEDHPGAPDPTDPASAYGEGKRVAELLCTLYHKKHGIEPKIARCFAFVGPYLPLNAHFAIGNFIRDAMAGGPIRITGDGTPYRSYLYACDLAIWLWTILLRGRPCRPYNVGSMDDRPLSEMAKVVAQHTGSCAVQIALQEQRHPPSRYVPDTRRSHAELGLTANTDLAKAIALTVSFHKLRHSIGPEP